MSKKIYLVLSYDDLCEESTPVRAFTSKEDATEKVLELEEALHGDERYLLSYSVMEIYLD